MGHTDDLLTNNERYASSLTNDSYPPPPARKVAVVACMDARLNIYSMLGLEARLREVS